MLIKVCGMTSKKDIDICIDNKVDIVGFLLQPPSKSFERADMLDLQGAKELISYVPSNVESCLLVHLKDIDKILLTIEELKPTMIQIQKQSELSFCNINRIKKTFPSIKIIKTFYINENIDIQEMINDIKIYIDKKLIDLVLLDSEKGGSGQIHNWDISAHIVKKIKCFPILLAGGLNPDNVKDAILKVQPYGIDVMSGVSTNLYNKDVSKLNYFVRNIRNS
jgi:phosphoribosylanthranilate isomerase